MGQIISFDNTRRPERRATVRPQPTGRKGFPNHHVQNAIVNQWLDGKDVRTLGQQLRREYGARFGEGTVQRILRDRVRFEEAA